jgi:type I restriction enzyme M protein
MQQIAIKNGNTEHLFKELYYHLYSNSNFSRSERILSDISKLILISIAYGKGEMQSEVSLFSSGNGSANCLLIPSLTRLFPSAVGPKENFALDDAALRHALKLLQEIDLASSPSHTFGDAFQALMGPRLRGDKGQFFTPRSVVRAMVDILAPTNEERVIDPACGTGGFLSAVLDRWRRDGALGTVIGIDKDRDLALLASALSTVHAGHGDVFVHNANSLALDSLGKVGVALGTFDCVLTNPPFGAKIGITDRTVLKQFALGHVWEREGKKGTWRKTDLIRSSQDPQVLFLELCTRLLKKDGRMGIVLPEGLFGNTGAGYIWDYLRSLGRIEGLIDCPRTTFQPSTDTKTNILLFTFGKQEKNTHKSCWVSVAYSCGHDRRGRSLRADGTSIPDDFARIAEDWGRPNAKRTIWNNTPIADPYYLVPRYYDQRLSDEVAQDATSMRSPVTTLGELATAGLISLRKGHEVGSDAYGSGEIPFIRTSDIHNFEVSHDPTNCISEEIYEQYRDQQKLKSGDILMVVDGRYKIGRCAILQEWTTRCVVQSHLRIISLTQSARFEPTALLFSLTLPSVQREIRRLVFIQSTLGGLGSRIGEIRLPDPRASASWGETVQRFGEAITTRARHAAYLQAFGNEIEL